MNFQYGFSEYCYIQHCDSLTLQLIGNSLLKEDGVSSLSLRYSDTKLRDTFMILNSRYPITDSWRITPLVQVDYRENKVLADDQWRIRPGLRLEYLFNRQFRFDIDGEYSYANQKLPGLAEDLRGYLVTVRFRWDFFFIIQNCELNICCDV